MNVYVCTNFKGHYPVGTAAVIVAEHSFSAAAMLREKLAAMGLRQDIPESSMMFISTDSSGVLILNDGDY